MKKIKVVGLVIGLIGVLGVGNAVAVDTATILVSAEISASCSITGSSNIAFGAIDPLTAPDPIVPATDGSVTVQCTDGTAVSFSATSVNDMTSGTVGTPLPYTPVLPANGQTPGFSGETYDVSATIALTDAQAAEEAADYSGSFVLNISY